MRSLFLSLLIILILTGCEDKEAQAKHDAQVAQEAREALLAELEAKKKQEGLIRPLTNKEKKNRRNLLFAGLAVFFVGLALLLFFLLR